MFNLHPLLLQQMDASISICCFDAKTQPKTKLEILLRILRGLGPGFGQVALVWNEKCPPKERQIFTIVKSVIARDFGFVNVNSLNISSFFSRCFCYKIFFNFNIIVGRKIWIVKLKYWSGKVRKSVAFCLVNFGWRTHVAIWLDRFGYGFSKKYRDYISKAKNRLKLSH